MGHRIKQLHSFSCVKILSTHHSANPFTLGVEVGATSLSMLASSLIFRGMWTGYYLSMALWIVLFSVVCYGYISPFSAGTYFVGDLLTISLSVLLYLYPLVYPIICLVYFLRKSVRTYFGTLGLDKTSPKPEDTHDNQEYAQNDKKASPPPSP
jgi:CBS domain containing-hemolysin-like protein